MLFMIHYELDPGSRDEVIGRFKETGGPPPAGVKMLGRWHDVGGNHGFVLAESTDAQAIFRWCHEWSDMLSFEVVPVIDDEQFTAVLGG